MRRCKVTAIGLKEPTEGYFHQWVTVDELRVSTRVKDAGNVTPVRVVRAVVEFDDGFVGLIKVDQIEFIKEENDDQTEH